MIMCLEINLYGETRVANVAIPVIGDETLCRRFRRHYLGRIAQFVSMDQVDLPGDADPARTYVNLAYFKDGDAARKRYEGRLSPPTGVDISGFRDAFYDFGTLMRYFPVRVTLEPDPVAKTDPVIGIEPVPGLPAMSAAYPRCRHLTDFWMPPEIDVHEYTADVDTLVHALKRDYPFAGPSSFERDSAYQLCAYAAMLAPDDATVYAMLEQAEEVVRTYSNSRMRLARIARRDELHRLLIETKRYIPEYILPCNMDADQLEYVHERTSCCIPFEGTMVPVDFAIDADMVISLAWLGGRRWDPTTLTIVAFDDEAGGRRRARPNAPLEPAV